MGCVHCIIKTIVFSGDDNGHCYISIAVYEVIFAEFRKRCIHTLFRCDLIGLHYMYSLRNWLGPIFKLHSIYMCKLIFCWSHTVGFSARIRERSSRTATQRKTIKPVKIIKKRDHDQWTAATIPTTTTTTGESIYVCVWNTRTCTREMRARDRSRCFCLCLCFDPLA